MRVVIISFYILTIFAACKKSTLPTYGGDADVFFTYAENNVLTDSVNISFGLTATVMEDTAVFYVNTIGKLNSQNRAYSLEVDQQRSTAVAGKHYRLPVADSFYIKGNVASDTIVIRAMRTPDLRDASVILYLKLVPNNLFGNTMLVHNYASPVVVPATTLRIVIDDIMQQPANWAASAPFLGRFSREKLNLMISTLSLEMIRFFPTGSTAVYTATQLSNYAKQFQQYLNTQKNLGNIIYEKDGTVMVMGPSAQ